MLIKKFIWKNKIRKVNNEKFNLLINDYIQFKYILNKK